jgi:diacylglycerol kinase (ATP)
VVIIVRLLVLHNPTAGNGRPDAGDLLRLLRDAGFEPVYVSTKDESFTEAMRQPAEWVIAAGGDGTVEKLATTLPERGRPVAILPLGGANNIARSLGIEGDLARLVHGLRDAPVQRLDTATARGPWGTRLLLEGIGFGALARSIADVKAAKPPSEMKIRVGQDALRRRIARDPGAPLGLSLDGARVEGTYLMVEAVIGGTIGPSLPLAPGADPGDGLLDVIRIEAQHRDAMLAWLDRRRPGEPPPGEVRRCRQLAVTWAGVPLRLDDDWLDPPDAPAEVRVTVDPEPLRVMVPRVAAERRSVPSSAPQAGRQIHG